MKNFLRLFLLFVLGYCFTSCVEQEPTDLSQISLVPIPVQTTVTGERFHINSETIIHYKAEQSGLQRVAELLAQSLRQWTQQDIPIMEGNDGTSAHDIYLLLLDEKEPNFGFEGYELAIEEDRIVILANEAAGIFRAGQTLQQLIPLTDSEKDNWMIPTGTITDYPEYSYRGIMLDVSRHFFQVEDVKRLIDLAAAFKINTLHLHLADDQGWRIEIKSWPNLALHGGSTQVDGGQGGYYTQEDYQEMVAYAADRYITIIPEIDMPGHTNAALASYPELNCDGKARELYTGTEVGFSTLCTSKEITYQFVDDVIRELAAMTPGPYIHIGGDESHVTALEDYIPFIERVQDIVHTHGKQMIGWDEISHARLDSTSVVQYWTRADNAIRGLEQGTQVLLSPAHKAYLDMQYDSTTELGLHWAAYIEVDSAYVWEPTALVDGLEREHILGIESPLWTETVTNMDEIEYMVFPRLIGHAEIGWSPARLRSWESYQQRLAAQAQRLQEMGIDYYPSSFIPWEK